jgi:tetrahydromethanopterin S-methyltransferase subunit B
VYKLTFVFTDRQGQARKAIAKTNLPEKLEANRLELIFYDAINSGNSTLLDNLPGKQALTERGELQTCGFGVMLGAVFVPFVALAVVVGGIVVKLS